MDMQFLSTILSSNVSKILMKTDSNLLSEVEEIRLRLSKPLVVHVWSRNQPLIFPQEIITKSDIDYTIQNICEGSLYAFLEQLKNGFITVNGGYRIGITGEVVTQNQEITNIKNISGLNIRIPHQVIGCANSVMPFLLTDDHVQNTLIISPPGYGKTTLLRDIARQVSNCGYQVAIADERGEIAGVVYGIPQYDVGQNTDILNLCPKIIGMNLLLRSMSPHVIITDEIGTQQDILAITDIINSGVSVITSIHGNSMLEVSRKIDPQIFNLKLLIKKDRTISALS